MATANNVTAGKPRIAGAVMYAEQSSTLTIPTAAPTTTTDTVPTGFTSLGYVSEDGVTNNNSASSNQTKAWGGDIVMTAQTEKPDEFTFKLIEALSVDVLKVVYGAGNVTGALSTGITVEANGKPNTAKAWVIDMIMTNMTLKRIVIPNGQISSVGEIAYGDSDAVGYELTINALPDDDGNTHYEYIKTVTA